MTPAIDETHDPALRSFVESANDPATDFPLQNLPFGRFRRRDDPEWSIGVAIGEKLLDLRGAGIINHSEMNRLMQLRREVRQELRRSLSEGLREDSPHRRRWEAALHAQSGVELGLPCRIGGYTDFYTSIHHATTVGKQFRPENPLLPNYKWMPIGYHGRSSSIFASGHRFKRPVGQVKTPDGEAPTLQATRRLDYELELGIFVSRQNLAGEPIGIEDAEDHVFGIALFNDWSARDIQPWEYQPLGPLLSKNFASTLSPWMVTLEALAPFRTRFERPGSDPAPLPYLDSQANRDHGAFNVNLEVWLQTARMLEAGHAGDRLATSNYCDAYWTVAQMVAHHTVNGCNLQPGDLFGSGTLSGPEPEQAGSLLELCAGGKRPLTLSNGEIRTFLEDEDTITLRGRCTRAGFRGIGFGECSGTVSPARPLQR